jgi:hypothetical protein
MHHRTSILNNLSLVNMSTTNAYLSCKYQKCYVCTSLCLKMCAFLLVGRPARCGRARGGRRGRPTGEEVLGCARHCRAPVSRGGVRHLRALVSRGGARGQSRRTSRRRLGAGTEQEDCARGRLAELAPGRRGTTVYRRGRAQQRGTSVGHRGRAQQRGVEAGHISGAWGRLATHARGRLAARARGLVTQASGGACEWA